MTPNNILGHDLPGVCLTLRSSGDGTLSPVTTKWLLRSVRIVSVHRKKMSTRVSYRGGGAWDPPLCEIRKCPCLFCLGSSVAQIGPLLAAPLGTVGTSCAPLGPPPLFAPLRTLIYRISSNLSDTFNYPGHSFEQFSLF